MLPGGCHTRINGRGTSPRQRGKASCPVRARELPQGESGFHVPNIAKMLIKEEKPKVKEKSEELPLKPIESINTETWTVNVRETREVEAMRMKFVRSMLAVMRRNKFRNEEDLEYREYMR
uniref:Uncharacterized protein n=1 Tax=Timema shepardi TaxID=629360 RepID=A0A7R9B787_TIMSH|nr:unnamed protein product [Timema shepardi]